MRELLLLCAQPGASGVNTGKPEHHPKTVCAGMCVLIHPFGSKVCLVPFVQHVKLIIILMSSSIPIVIWIFDLTVIKGIHGGVPAPCVCSLTHHVQLESIRKMQVLLEPKHSAAQY